MPNQCEILLHDRPKTDNLTRLQICGSATMPMTVTVISHPYNEEPEDGEELSRVLTDDQADRLAGDIQEFLSNQDKPLNFHAQDMNDEGTVMLCLQSDETGEVWLRIVHFDKSEVQQAAVHIPMNLEEASAFGCYLTGTRKLRPAR